MIRFMSYNQSGCWWTEAWKRLEVEAETSWEVELFRLDWGQWAGIRVHKQLSSKARHLVSWYQLNSCLSESSEEITKPI